jgi:hypothetical protein
VRYLKLALLLPAVLFLAATAWGQTLTSAGTVPKSDIVGSAHDLRTLLAPSGGTVPSYMLCNFCHIAHKTANTLQAYANAPSIYLWNHTLSSVTSYGVYSSPSFDALGTDIADLGGQETVSNLCLSCHDGTVAVNSFYQAQSGLTTTAVYVDPSATVNNLAQTHPVNFTYSAQLATAAGLVVPASTSSVDGGGVVPLFNGKMQCGTCHDPHNGTSHIFERPFPTQTSGTFCTYCHQ